MAGSSRPLSFWLVIPGRCKARNPVASSRSRVTPAGSVDLLVRVHAPKTLLLDPAVEAVAGDMAPVCGALLHLGDDAALELGSNRAVGIGPVVDRRQIVLV